MPRTTAYTSPFAATQPVITAHRIENDHREPVSDDLAPTIAEWLTKNHNAYRRTHDFERLVYLDVKVQKRACIDPDLDFATNSVSALTNTYSNIQFLTDAARAERRRGIENHWTYDVPRHSALVRAIAAETAIAIWMERVITLRAGIPKKVTA